LVANLETLCQVGGSIPALVISIGFVFTQLHLLLDRSPCGGIQAGGRFTRLDVLALVLRTCLSEDQAQQERKQPFKGVLRKWFGA
jgi:hypothetical protein